MGTVSGCQLGWQLAEDFGEGTFPSDILQHHSVTYGMN